MHVTIISLVLLLQSTDTLASTTVGLDNSTVASTPPEPEIKCYPYVGCFDNSPPFDNAMLDLPNSPEEVGTQFLLYTPSNKNTPYWLDYTDLNSVTASPYKSSYKTKFIIHGFTNNINSSWIYEMKDELLKVGDFNVIVVVWGPGASFPNYPQAAANTRMVGTQVRLVVDMMTREGANLNDFHLIGHSLGAHTSGYAGYLLHGQVGRITGLDPAEPEYEHHPKEIRLDSADARFVDAIHTNGASITSGGAGLMQRSGHVDFYVNGGETQPGCPNQVTGLLSNLLHGKFTSLGDTVSCSHSRSHVYFTESINSLCPFTAYPCSDYDKFKSGECLDCGETGCPQLGYYADQYQARGKMYLNTKLSQPFCGFHYAVHLSPLSDAKGSIYVQLHGDWGSSGWITLTEDSTEIKAGAAIQKVVISSVEVGDITDVDLRYNKHKGSSFSWFNGDHGGASTLDLHDVTITSGEIGGNYLFCAQGNTLSDGKPVAVSRSRSQVC